MTQTQANTEKLCNFISEKFESDQLNNDSLVQIIEHCGSFLNLQTIPDYSNKNKISYNGVKKFRNIKKIFNVKFVIDNE
jgi:hypothetical protein